MKIKRRYNITIKNQEENTTETVAEKVSEGNTVTVHYHGTLEDGSVFDSSYDRGEPINFTAGAGQMIKGFESNVLGMTLGQKKKFTIMSDDAYGNHNPAAVQKIAKENFPSDFEFTIGAMVQGTNPSGQPVVGKIVENLESEVSLDFNHPMAGKDLTFEIEIVSIGDGKQ